MWKGQNLSNPLYWYNIYGMIKPVASAKYIERMEKGKDD